MELTVVRPSGSQVFNIVWIELHTPLGSFVVQKNHAPMIVTLAANKELLFVLKSGKHESLPVKQGIVEITREKVMVLLNE
jgi:F0F1-type ATP synthase epsilon subunit